MPLTWEQFKALDHVFQGAGGCCPDCTRWFKMCDCRTASPIKSPTTNMQFWPCKSGVNGCFPESTSVQIPAKREETCCWSLFVKFLTLALTIKGQFGNPVVTTWRSSSGYFVSFSSFCCFLGAGCHPGGAAALCTACLATLGFSLCYDFVEAEKVFAGFGHSVANTRLDYEPTLTLVVFTFMLLCHWTSFNSA